MADRSSRRAMFALAGIAGALLSTDASANPGFILATSTFDADTEGWGVVEGPNMGVVTHVASGGQPGGHLRWADSSSFGASFVAPPAFTGDMSAATCVGGVSFDWRSSAIDASGRNGAVILENGPDLIVAAVPITNSDQGTWLHLDFRFDATGGWEYVPAVGLRRPATTADIRSVLRNVTRLRIGAESRGGQSEVVDLDNPTIYTTCICPPSGMVAWFGLDEPSGNIAIDIANANEGSFLEGSIVADGLTNGPLPAPGRVDLARAFDGVNDSIRVPDDPSLNHGTGGFSIDMWINLDVGSISGTKVLLSKRDALAFASGGVGFELRLVGGSPEIALSDGTTLEMLNGQLSLAPNLWQHLAVTVGSTIPGGATCNFDSVQIYLNGQLLNSGVPCRRVASIDVPDPMRIGGDPGSASSAYHGSIDEVEIFGRVLSATEVLDLFQAGSGGKCKIDCNKNGIVDSIEIARDPTLDADGDGALDECHCQPDCNGDVNGDGLVNFDDIIQVLGSWQTVCP